MSEIPEDVMQVARVTAHKALVGLPLGKTPEQAKRSIEYSAEFIARAIIAERERCAQIAMQWKRKRVGIKEQSFDPCGRYERSYIYEEGRPGNLIAAAIRNPEPPKETE